jgi:hypothetical protein
MNKPTEAELAALEDAAQRADQARSDAELKDLLEQLSTPDICVCDTCQVRRFERWSVKEPALDPDEPVPHRSRFRPSGPAEGR